jgi:hypothetical protein
MRRIIIYLAIALMVGGCSRIEINKTSDSTYSGGLRFYRPDLYLLVTQEITPESTTKTQTKDGSTTTTETKSGETTKTQTAIIALPNKNEEYVLKPVPRLGTVDLEATLTDGWNLTKLGAKVDTKIPETITALTGTLSAAAAAAVKGVRGVSVTKPLEPGLYRIEFENGQVSGIKKIF